MNLTKTSKALGYPNRNTLRDWVKEAYPTEYLKQLFKHANSKPKKCFSLSKKQEVVEKYLNGEADYKLASQFNISRATIYKWKEELLVKVPIKMKKKTTNGYDEDLPENKEELQKIVKSLQEEIYHLRLEKDVLQRATEILKKGKGVNLKNLTNQEKSKLIGALNKTYKLKDVLVSLSISKSSYFYQKAVLAKDDKYKELRIKVKAIFNESNNCYGYRRIHANLKKESIKISEKVIKK